MRVTLVVAVFWMSLNTAAYGQSTTIMPEWVFISTPLKWQPAPAKLGVRVHIAPAALIVLYPHGEFAELDCVLIQQKDTSIAISHGDRFVVRRGTWRATEDKLEANASVVFRTVPIVDQPMPEPPVTEHFTIKQSNGRKEIQESGGKNYEASPKFNDLHELMAAVDSQPSQ